MSTRTCDHTDEYSCYCLCRYAMCTHYYECECECDTKDEPDDDDDDEPEEQGDLSFAGAIGLLGAAFAFAGVASAVERPGWYDDGSDRTRWWDGVQWTHHYLPTPTPPPPVAVPTVPPAGWYRDSAGAMRWWDGARWTHYIA